MQHFLFKVALRWDQFCRGRKILILGDSGACRKKFREVQGYGRPRRGSGGGAPQTPENFLKFAKKFLRKLQKCIILGYFSKNLTNHALVFRAFGRKTQILGKF